MQPLPTVTCACGFTVTGTDEYYNLLAYQDHDCPNTPPRRWHQSLFSMWTAVILGIAGYAAFLIVSAIEVNS